MPYLLEQAVASIRNHAHGNDELEDILKRFALAVIQASVAEKLEYESSVNKTSIHTLFVDGWNDARQATLEKAKTILGV